MKITHAILILSIFLMGAIQETFSTEIIIIEKTYSKEYDADGILIAEGWKSMDVKIDYWIFYHPNGTIASKGHFNTNEENGYWHFYNDEGILIKEGHFAMGSAEKWWIFYDIATKHKSKFQFKNNKKNGFALRYKKNKLVKAEEYQNGVKIDEWTSIIAFKLDNPNISLR